jgi:cell division protein FtsI/penicillin-binding protein 2
MPDRFTTDKTALERPSWRDYQAGLKSAAAKKRLYKIILKFSPLILVIFVVVYGIISGAGGKASFPVLTDSFASLGDKKIDTDLNRGKVINKRDVQTLLDSTTFANLKNKSFDFVANGSKLRVDTSLDISLQNFLLKKVNLSTSRYIGIVGIDPVTGKILSMVGFDKTDDSNNPCLDNRFPAASIFKIVTASAAVEKCGFNLDSKLTYNGKKHTLYKSQLKDRKNRYTNRITFRESFAQSVNPVFGKIGAHYLGKTTLEKYAAAFGFNRVIDFEIQLAPSAVSLSDEPYQWAEIASGFNQETKMSPLHGALMAAAIINEGSLIEPTIVNQITDEEGQILYRGQSVTINQVITPEASKVVNRLMGTTIRSGTLKKTFRGYKRNKILSKLNIGGKTGSIDNNSHDVRYDWFVGFAEEKEGPGKIAISVIVAHEKYIGIRASQYARMVITQYFKNYFSKV